ALYHTCSHMLTHIFTLCYTASETRFAEGGGLYLKGFGDTINTMTTDPMTVFACNAVAGKTTDNELVGGGGLATIYDALPGVQATFIGNSVGRLSRGPATGGAYYPVTLKHGDVNEKDNIVCGRTDVEK